MDSLALNYKEIQAFETALRKAIEHSELQEAEALIRAALRDPPDALLEKVFDRPLDRLRIRDWDNIGADMEGARRSVPEPELEHEWAAVLLGLINRNHVAGLPISVKFTFDAEPAGRPAEQRVPPARHLDSLALLIDSERGTGDQKTQRTMRVPRGTKARSCLEGTRQSGAASRIKTEEAVGIAL